MPTSILVLLVIAIGLWLAGFAACCLSLLWSTSSSVNRFPAAIIMPVVALAVGYLGFARYEISYAKTINGEGWTISSKWFFLALMIFAAISIAIAVWNRVRTRALPSPGTPGSAGF